MMRPDRALRIAQAVRAISRLPQLDRRRIRAEFERRFTSRRMAEDYVRHYQMLAARSANQAARAVAGAQERDQLSVGQVPPMEAQRNAVDTRTGENGL